MDSNRLKRVSTQIQKDLSEILRLLAQEKFQGLLLSTTYVKIAPDLSLARAYVSIFPATNKDQIIDWLNDHSNQIKDQLVRKLKGQLRKMPELIFHLDDTIDYKDNIEKLLRGEGDSPIQ